ncbi:MAG: small ribosomal subunit Rsm22 family protein [Eubacteriales bacterium]
MDIPQALRTAIDEQLMGAKQDRITKDAEAISLRYRTGSGKGERLITSEAEAAAYAAARMPATFAAVRDALGQSLSSLGGTPLTLLDAGAGTGAAAWVADSLLSLKSVVCLEREGVMSGLGQRLMKLGSPALSGAKWLSRDLVRDDIPERADLVVASYVLNEMTREDRAAVSQKLWDAVEMLLLIVEPGTPAGYSNLLEVRELLLARGAELIAPCPHSGTCSMTDKDWCHFSSRVARSRLHRQVKGGEAPYEDEKYSYLAFSRIKRTGDTRARILRHPQIMSGYMTLEVCSAEGLKQIKLSKKDGEKYKQARKSKAGDLIL